MSAVIIPISPRRDRDLCSREGLIIRLRIKARIAGCNEAERRGVGELAARMLDMGRPRAEIHDHAMQLARDLVRERRAAQWSPHVPEPAA